jgi:Sec7-like guanine-nucleotide exchange factor
MQTIVCDFNIFVIRKETENRLELQLDSLYNHKSKTPIGGNVKKKLKLCLVSCSVLRKEIEKLVQQGKLDAEVIFVSKYFHVDYSQIERNLRPAIERALRRYPGRVILV